jgi:hypothetical protein
MSIAWDKSNDRIWFGKWLADGAPCRLYLIVECLPDRSGWDWAVWRSDGLSVAAYGTLGSVKDAAFAAESVAEYWRDRVLTYSG